jgi:Zn finger protein HypA/HybF involved in hydrogenase expression
MNAWNDPVQTMTLTVPCQHCGEPVPSLTRHKRTCPRCRKEKIRVKNARRAPERSPTVRKPITVPCMRCGVPVDGVSRQHKVCPRCRKLRKRAYNREHKAAQRAGQPSTRRTRQEILAEYDPRYADDYRAAPPDEPILDPPGSAAKIAALAARAAAGEELFDDRDADGWEDFVDPMSRRPERCARKKLRQIEETAGTAN